MSPDGTAARAEQVARAAYGHLLALLAAATGDIPTAEDALSDAFVQALTTWPVRGVPNNPEAWLLTVARNRLRDLYASSAHRTSVPWLDLEPAVFDHFDLEVIPDKRLELLFVCAHPAIEAGIRTPLMLHTVLGFEASQIATAFAVPAPAMAQRLVRAKRRIRDARIPFTVPTRQDMPARLPAVLEAIYGAYAIDWVLLPGEGVRLSLSGEALYLAATLAALLEDEPEVFGLAALIALSLSRADARVVDGEQVPLDEQDTALWDAELIAQGEAWLRRAHSFGRIGRFQLEAAIQSVHSTRAISGSTDWEALRKLYEGLMRVAPTLGAAVSRAAAIAHTEGPAVGLAALDAITDAAVERFQPAWATRAHLLAEAGRSGEAAAAFTAAISLTVDPVTRAYLTRRAARVL
ncbi:RNA polymerase sigma factor [Glaciibacter sp. 2TAF33]|uniref:RNA polymerase sigma factor n=1 Tax=Glaciibacter sp. 2TAF33 TaxID=3233015 RepID=UPI003F8D999B